jgi:PP-loop superfamily ATP-utilizing enzyme
MEFKQAKPKKTINKIELERSVVQSNRGEVSQQEPLGKTSPHCFFCKNSFIRMQSRQFTDTHTHTHIAALTLCQ